MADAQQPLTGIPAVGEAGERGGLPGPFSVGSYAAALRRYLRGRARVRVIGEVTGLRIAGKSVYFELRDADGAIPCAMWRSDWDKLELSEGAVSDGSEVVVSGGPDFYPGSATASPSFSFRCTDLRLAGEGDLLAQLAVLRRKLRDEGLFELQRRLPRTTLPRTIGIVTGRGSAAEADLLAGLGRRGWAGRAVFAHPPVQDRHAAPQIARALSDLAAIPEIEVILVARGGGSLADLWAFCDETLCRTVAMLRVPVISAVGHESDRTLLDDVAAVSCSTPTHATEQAVRVDVGAASSWIGAAAGRLVRGGREAAAVRARRLAGVARTLGHHTDGQRRDLHQMIREMRASSARALDRGAHESGRRALVLSRKREAAIHAVSASQRGLIASASSLARNEGAAPAARAEALARLAQTLAAHEPERVLERGYAIVTDRQGDLISKAATARDRSRLRVRFADDDVAVEVTDDE
jgi:exodeoxyribonuclease VII large subunit